MENEEMQKPAQTQGNGDKIISFKLTLKNGVLLAIGLCILSSLVSTVLSFYLTNRHNFESEESKTILIGSGTVYQYLSNEVEDLHKKTIYIPSPSITAFHLLREEKNSVSSVIDDNCWLILSAVEANESNFYTKDEQKKFINETGKIIEVYLGFDSLKIFVSSKDQFASYLGDSDATTVDQLRSLLNSEKDKLNIFATSENSATRLSYEKLIGDTLSNTSFFDLDTKEGDFLSNNGKKCLVLASSVYCPQSLQGYHSYSLKSAKDTIERKELFLYFTAHKVNGELVIKKKLQNTLNEIRGNRKVDIKDYKNTNKLILRDPFKPL